jgi:hypothetical protein
MNDPSSEQHDDAPSSSEPLNGKESPVESGAVPAPDEQDDASSLQAASIQLMPELPTSSRGDAASTMPDAGGGGGGSSASDSQSPATEEKPIAPAAAPARNAATAEVHDPRPDGSSEESNKVDTKDSSSAPHPEPPIVPKVKIHLVAVGSAPILKRTKFQIGA